MESLPTIVPARDLHRKVVAADLEQVAEQAHAIIDRAGCTATCPHWDVLRAAADVAQALADVLPAADALGIEGRDLTALSEHAISVLASTVAAVDTTRDAARA